MKRQGLLEQPRHSHYLLGHEAFRQAAEADPEYFFHLMASQQQSEAIAQLTDRVYAISDDDQRYEQDDFRVHLTNIEARPAVIIELPKPRAFIECVYCAVVSQADLTALQAMASGNDELIQAIDYFTLELMENESGEVSYALCRWQQDTHFFLAEVEGLPSIEKFSAVIKAALTPPPENH
ncbi:MAG: hypothetical protein HWE13_03470 [Gammaproteobacteria bacterium]|nr:hypothetical protein [Gammaproteobacteria bacterium]NVK87153.1 hypothetical protein [Gammaproteobacteria bacterium]